LNPFSGAGPVGQKLVSPAVSAGISTSVAISRQNADSDDIIKGELLYAASNSTVAKALADSSTKQKVLGFAKIPFAVGVIGVVQIADLIEATTDEWDAVTGMVGGLVAGAHYYLDPTTKGRMTTTPPSTDGQYVVRVGWALSSTEFQIDIEPSVLL